MFRGVHLKLVFKKNKVYGSKEKVRGNLGKNPRNLNGNSLIIGNPSKKLNCSS